MAAAASQELVTSTSLADEIAFRLERGILEGEHPPGTHLLQDEICSRFGVSRTPVREALRILQAQNLVVVTPNKGATVRVPTRSDLAEVYAVRANLEGFACELAAAAADADLLAELDEAQGMIEAATETLRSGQLTDEMDGKINVQLTRGNDAFHHAIFRAAGNQRLTDICVSLQRYFPKEYVWRATRLSPEATEALHIAHHREVRDALAAHDGDRARAAMEHHIDVGGSTLMSYLDERGFWDNGSVHPD